MGTDLFEGADRALLHHSDFGRLPHDAGNFLIDLLHESGLRGGTVVDLGCGAGILARVLLDGGYDVFGVDPSQAMLDLAAREAPEAQFWCGSVLEAPLPMAAAVAATGEVLNYAADRRAGYNALAELARRVEEALVPGGVFLFDLSTPGRCGPDGVLRQWRDRAEMTLYMESYEHHASEILDRRVTIFHALGSGTYRRSDERQVLRLFDPEIVLEQLASAGLRPEEVGSYPASSPMSPPDGWSVFVARK
jgi:SAM-dependent methyltransferase